MPKRNNNLYDKLTYTQKILAQSIKNSVSRDESGIKIKKRDPFFQLKNTKNQEKMIEEVNIYYQIDEVDTILDTTLQKLMKRMETLTINSITKVQVQELFAKQKKQQSQKINQQKQAYSKYFTPLHTNSNIRSTSKFTINHDWRLIFQNHTLGKADLDTLNYNKDINDAVVNLYIHLIRKKIVNIHMQEQSYAFSTYFMSKLIGVSNLEDQKYMQKISSLIPQQFEKKVQINYNQIRRWTKNNDIFTKDYLIIPINSLSHWSLILVLFPNAIVKKNQKKPSIIFLDSFGQKNKALAQAIRIYLKKQLIEKKIYQNPQNTQINQATLPDYQFLLPRQTNYHDCGLYMLAYIEQLLLNATELDLDFERTQNRMKLRIFPRSLIFTMRYRLKNLYIKMSQNKISVQSIFEQYLKQKGELISNSKQIQYDKIDELQFKKYLKVNNLENIQQDMQKYFNKLILFYTKADYNYYQPTNPF